jgi:hypothetical protein
MSRLWDRWSPKGVTVFGRRELGRMASLLMFGGVTRSRSAAATWSATRRT